MKRSEAMDKLREMVYSQDATGACIYSARYWESAARALLNAESDLPWEVKLHSSPSGQGYYPNVLVARCNSEHAAMHAAKLWGVQYATISCTDLQTVCDDEDEQTESKGCIGFNGDLLNAQDDLPWRVRDDVDGSVAAFELEQDACAYASECLGDEATITGPTQNVDHDEQKPTESKYIPAFEGDPDDCAFKHPPRLVPVTEQIVEVDGKYYRVVIE